MASFSKSHGRLPHTSKKRSNHGASSKNVKTCCKPMTDEEANALPEVPLSGKYSIKDLGQLLSRGCTPPWKAAESLRKLLSKARSSGKAMEDLVIKCFPLLDAMHFYGLLQQADIKIIFVDNIESEGSLGFQEIRKGKNTPLGSRQQINLRRIPDIPSFHEHYFNNYLGVLVHEMIHTFFALYQCRGSQKCIKANAIQEGEFGDNPGHGPAFRRAEDWIPLLGEFLSVHNIYDHIDVLLVPKVYIEPAEVICRCCDCCQLGGRDAWKEDYVAPDDEVEKVTRGDKIVDMSSRERSKYNDRLKKVKRKFGDDKPKEKVSWRSNPLNDKRERECGRAWKNNPKKYNAVRLRKEGVTEVGEIAKRMDEKYRLRTPYGARY